ncbi:unannotated protein [freshwater metagenome]|uniref:Unannotated protein n=1 Tax=freshwater metagenome TaxID=449393 RepID=A0A6J7P3Z6_9ZZZZ
MRRGGIDQGHRRLEPGRGDSGLHVHREQVEHRDSGALGARARGGRTRDVRCERAGHRERATNGCVDIVEQVGWVAGVEVGGLGRVDHRPPAHRHIPVEAPLSGKSHRVGERLVGRLNPHLVEHHDVKPGTYERLPHLCQLRKLADPGVGEQRNSRHSEAARPITRFGQHARAESDGRRVDGKDRLAALVGGEVRVTAGHGTPRRKGWMGPANVARVTSDSLIHTKASFRPLCQTAGVTLSYG